MKKSRIVMALALMILTLAACSDNETLSEKENLTLSIALTPTKDVEEILIASDPLKDILKSELAEKGFTVENIDIAVGVDQNVPAEALISGSMDISVLPASVFAQYRKDGINLLVETLSHGVGDSKGKVIEPEDGIAPWNSGITTDANDMVGGNVSLIYVNIASEKGAELYEKATNNNLTWDDVNSARWYVSSFDSYDGYIYPSLWINDNFGEGIGSTRKTVAGLKDVVPDSSYDDMISFLFEGKADVITGYADLRKDASAIEQFEKVYADKIADGTHNNIWDVIKVIGVTDKIMNDAVCIADRKINPKMKPEFVAALQDVFIELDQSEEGLECFDPFDYKGFKLGYNSDYDSTLAAESLFQ